MITLYDPAEPRPLLVNARQEWGHNHYEVREGAMGSRPATELVFRRGDEAKPGVQTSIWLPWMALEHVSGMMVNIYCQKSGVRLYLDCLDADGWGMRFNLGRDSYEGWHAFRYDPGDVNATWGTCAGKKYPLEPLQPVALVIEDAENRGSFTLGLGKIDVQGEPAATAPPTGMAACNLDRHTLAMDLMRGGEALLSGLGLSGYVSGATAPTARRLGWRNINVVAHNHFRADLASIGTAVPVDVELQQLSSQLWLLQFELQPQTPMKLERLDLKATISMRAAVGLSYAAEEEELGVLDGVPVADSILAEPAIWEPLVLARGDSKLRIKAGGPVLKTLRLLDLRVEEDLPEYALEVVVARDEVFAPGSHKFNLLLDAKD